MTLTQRQLIDLDAAEIRRLLETHPDILQVLGDSTDPGRHARFVVVAELMWNLWFNAMAVGVLIDERLEPPLLTVQRAVLEGLAVLAYLVRHPKSQDEAIVFLAFSHLDDLEVFKGEPLVVAERKDLLARMPVALVKLAQKRRNERPHTWSGLTIRGLVSKTPITGYDTLYRHLSRHAHSGAAAGHVRVVRRDGHMAHVQFGGWISERDSETYANFARRSLHRAFRYFWDVFGGPPVAFQVPNPEAWLVDRDGSQTEASS